MTADGLFKQAELTSCGLNGNPLKGVGRYSAHIACNLWSSKGAGRYDADFPRIRFAAHPYLTQSEADGNEKETQYIANMSDGAVAGFKYFDLDRPDQIAVEIRGKAQGMIIVSTDSRFDNCLSGIPVDLKTKTKAFGTYSAKCETVSGVYPLFFKFSGIGSVDFWAFRLIAPL
jgi:hypothetical protein